MKSAVIWPEPKSVASRNTTKTDPVNRFQQYQQEWSKSKVPEEKKHKNLRWAVREQMLYKDVIYEVGVKRDRRHVSKAGRKVQCTIGRQVSCVIEGKVPYANERIVSGETLGRDTDVACLGVERQESCISRINV